MIQRSKDGSKEPSRQGKKFNWNEDNDSDDELKEEKDSSLNLDAVNYPTDVCIICLGSCSRSGSRLYRFRRIDSLRRHLIELHFCVVVFAVSASESSPIFLAHAGDPTVQREYMLPK